MMALQVAAIGRAAAGRALDLLLRRLRHHRSQLAHHVQAGATMLLVSKACIAPSSALMWDVCAQSRASELLKGHDWHLNALPEQVLLIGPLLSRQLGSGGRCMYAV